MGYHALSPETIDGLELEARLAGNPKIVEARLAFWARVAAFHKRTANKSKAEMIAELKASNPAYIVSLLEASDEQNIRDRYVMTFYKTETAT